MTGPIRWVAFLIVGVLFEACSSSPSQESAAQPQTDQQLVAAATDIVHFLQGQAPFSGIGLAPTVTLRLAKAGGGSAQEISRDSLSDLKNWRVTGASGTDYSFIPPGEGTLVTKVGKHLNCMEYDLADALDGAKAIPHVGTMIRPIGSDSCLQVWNLTLLFDPAIRTPTLTSAIYDQWEW